MDLDGGWGKKMETKMEQCKTGCDCPASLYASRPGMCSVICRLFCPLLVARHLLHNGVGALAVHDRAKTVYDCDSDKRSGMMKKSQ